MKNMKTSNILLTAFVVGITLYLLLAFTEVRISGKRNSLGREYVDHNIAVAKFQSIDATNAELHIRFTTESSVAFSIEAGQPVSHPNALTRGDTLVIVDRDGDEQQDRFVVTLPAKGMTNLTCHQCRVFVQDGSKEILELNLSASIVIRHRSDSAHINLLKLYARDNSRIELTGLTIDTLAVDIGQSEAVITTSVYLLSGTLQDRARLILDDATRMDFERDAQSLLHFRR
jgi:hypothetical protein